jgi:hypothetical protein
VTPQKNTTLDAGLELVADPVTENIPAVGALERLPKWLNLIPMIVQWLWLSLRYRSLTLPTAANPGITAGGMVGEGKSEYFRIMGPLARSHTSDFVLLRNRRSVSIVQEAERIMQKAELRYPLILKPDIGWCGFGVRIVRDRDELRSYLQAYPEDQDIILQRFVTYEGEAGLYYIRNPSETRGRVCGVLLRHFPRVVGDGRCTIAELMARIPRLRRLGRDGLSEPCCDTSRVPAVGEQVRVTVTGSTRVGGLYQDATDMVTPQLEAAIDRIANDMQGLHVARFDVRYESLGAMQAGKAFQIIEVNGAGSEAVHAWDPRYTLAQAYSIVFEKQRTLFATGAAMRACGHKPVGIIALAQLFLHQARLIRSYPPSN